MNIRKVFAFLLLVLISFISGCSTGQYSDDMRYKVGKPYQIDGKWYYPHVDEGYKEQGMASWYGPGFHGKKTANGDRFNKNSLTAAHRTLPMPSVVKVKNLENGKEIILTVNDRGPYKKNRIIDLSEAAAKELDMKHKGAVKVEVTYLKHETASLLSQLNLTPPAEKYKYAKKIEPQDQYQKVTVALNANKRKTESNANKLINNVVENVATKKPSEDVYLQLASFKSKSNALKLKSSLTKDGFTNALLDEKTNNFKVLMGPYKSKKEAEATASKLAQARKLKPMVIASSAS